METAVKVGRKFDNGAVDGSRGFAPGRTWLPSKLTLMIFIAKFSLVNLSRTRFTTANPPVPRVSMRSYFCRGCPSEQLFPSSLVDASRRTPPPRDFFVSLFPRVGASTPASEDAQHPMIQSETGDADGARIEVDPSGKICITVARARGIRQRI